MVNLGCKGQIYTTWACPGRGNGAVFGGGAVQEALQGTDEADGPQVSRQKLLEKHFQ